MALPPGKYWASQEFLQKYMSVYLIAYISCITSSTHARSRSESCRTKVPIQGCVNCISRLLIRSLAAISSHESWEPTPNHSHAQRDLVLASQSSPALIFRSRRCCRDELLPALVIAHPPAHSPRRQPSRAAEDAYEDSSPHSFGFVHSPCLSSSASPSKISLSTRRVLIWGPDN
jgi:hypothetical protein